MKSLHYSTGCVLLAIIFFAGTACAGGYSDHHSRKSSASGSSARTLKYGGTYGQAAQNYINNRDNWKVPSAGGTGQTGQKAQMTPQQRAEYERAMQQANRILNNAYNRPANFGTGTRQISTGQQQQINRAINNADSLIDRINNDPLLK